MGCVLSWPINCVRAVYLHLWNDHSPFPTASETFANCLKNPTVGYLFPPPHPKNAPIAAINLTKKVVLPLQTSIRIKSTVNVHYLSNFLYIHEPRVVSRASQKEPSRIKYLQTLATQRDPESVKSFHIKLMVKTWETSHILLMPNPPSDLGRQTSSDTTFAFLFELGELLHKKALHIFSNSVIHRFGKWNTEHQNLVILEMTEFMSCNRSANDKCQLVHLKCLNPVNKRLMVNSCHRLSGEW